ncbi:hypothetical protein SLEP1_g10802 [Rubroshorea leprosula]|uniref:RING-type domain-containing protein n=1 Tax=Rubroshorea leprosula TaxID=152421 RepID=A0AAV5IF55_9ROSI|nr:hypothetical protein SLEP1_g10802 [Rubroshorea leprosula]
MGLGINDGDDLVVDDGDGGGDDADCGNAGKSFGSVSCSICLETVTDNGDRSWAKLQCGHQFHLDCIGSAFNIKGAMQCPNCRRIEKGQWLYANGCRSLPEFSMDDWAHDEDLYDLNYTEMSFGVQWCPFGSLTRLPSSFEEVELSSTAYQDLVGHNAIFAEHSAVSSASHPCPYIAYLGPIHPSSSNSNGSVSDSSNFNSYWNGPSVPSEVPTSYAFPAMDLHYRSWDSTPFSTSNSRLGNADQPSMPSVNQRSTRTSSDIPRSGAFMHPFLVSHSSGARAGSSVPSAMIPPYPGSNARARDRIQALQAYYQQQQPSSPPAIRTSVISGSRRANSHRGMGQAGPVASTSDQAGRFYIIPSGTPGLNSEAENPLPARFHARERNHLSSFSINPVDRESGWSFHQVASVSDSSSGIRSSSFRPRHGSERTSSQNRS